MPKLLCEYADTQVKTEGKKLYLEGVFATHSQPTKNGRTYLESTMDREVDKLQSKIAENKLLGELSHPTGDGATSVNFDRVSHKIVSLKKEGNNYIGKAQVLDTPAGKILKNLVSENCAVGMSTRGYGSLGKDGIVGEDYQMITCDAVSNPSNSQAWMKALKESVLNESLSVEESALAMKIITENNQPTLIDRTLRYLEEQRNLGMGKLDKLGHGMSQLQSKMEIDNTGGIFDGHAGFPSLDDPGKCHYDREKELTLRIIANLLGLEDDMENVDSSQSDDTGLNTRHSAGYIKRTLQTRWDRNLEQVIRDMQRKQPIMAKRAQQFKSQQDLNWKTLSRIFKGKI